MINAVTGLIMAVIVVLIAKLLGYEIKLEVSYGDMVIVFVVIYYILEAKEAIREMLEKENSEH